ncbi:apolipoprotein N-acyltransferase [Sphingomonas sp. KR1UV-12]|uniref:Apolipoprotein N-acyltransferase n=1 Tax=Sphingomonas aurea TaxID=3063994 RepID=A0ABT9ENL6_9SPHN|nr:apolipoprotein N-acyltransferase [Sphingomonas sp. KR1UV-12]MDP1028253.1 apolipoprotein N-acyltransferase [Sphingomonas sp. KR1UV-12]
MTRHPALLSLILGAVAACGFAPLDLWPVALACLAAWLALVHAASTLRAALWRGWLFGLGHFTINNNWFQHAFDFQDKMPPVLGYFAAVALALYLAVYPMAAAGIAWRFRGRAADAAPDTAYVLVFAAAWIATEYLRAVLFTGYAWDPLGVLWLPAIGVARVSTLVGTYALSGLTIVVAGSLLMLAKRRWTLPAIVLPVTALAALSALWTHAPAAAPDAPRVRVVQPNIGNEARTGAGERSLQALIRLSGRPGPVPRLIVWPEGLIVDFLESGYPDYIYADRRPFWLRSRIADVLGPRDLLLTNAPRLGFDADNDIASAANSVLAIGPDAQIRGTYDKAHLVPYGEYLPMPWLLRPLGLARLVPGDMDFSPGPGPRAIDWPGFGPVGLQVCYEIIFSGEVVDEARRPRIILNPSNDAWFGKWGSPQFLAQARLRAIEEGLPVVRSTPTGISAIIAADGTLLATVPHETAGAIELPMPPALPPTLFARTGNAAAAIVAALLFALAIAIRRRAR